MIPIPGLAEITIFTKIGSFFKKLFTSPWLYVILAFVAIAGGTFFYLKHDKSAAVESARIEATEQANTSATIQSYEAQTETSNRTHQIDQDYQVRREQTARDYANARNSVQDAPVEERDAPAPRVIIDTLNELDRMHQQRVPPDSVHYPDDPVG